MKNCTGVAPMTRRTLLLTSLVGGVLSAIIVAIVTAAIGGQSLVIKVITSLLVGLSSGIGIFLAFKSRLGKKGC